MATTHSDFVQVQLTAAGAALAGKSSVKVLNGHFAYKFAAGVPVKVLTSEWQKVLSKKRVKGQLLFEQVPAATPAAPAAAAAAPAPAAAAPIAPAGDDPQLARLKAQEAAIKAEEAALQSKSVPVQTK